MQARFWVHRPALQRVAEEVNRWQHARMSGYSEDLREKIVLAVRRGMSKTRAARTFSVSLSSVKRYVNKADRGEPLAPKKPPGSARKLDEKAIKLLEEDLKEHPYARLQQRCDYLEAVSGIRVSRSTVCRQIKRMNQSRKKGPRVPQSETSFKEQPGG
jgi:transposase